MNNMDGNEMEYEQKDGAMIQEEFSRIQQSFMTAGYHLLDYNVETDGKVAVAVFQYGMFKIRFHLALVHPGINEDDEQDVQLPELDLILKDIEQIGDKTT